MKLSGYKKASEEYSGKASDINRNLLFAGIAIIWIFKKDTNGGIDLPQFLLYPLLTFVIGLITDLLQYVDGYHLWHDFFRRHEKRGISEETDVLDYNNLGVVISRYFWVKLTFTLFGYILLGIFIIDKIVS